MVKAAERCEHCGQLMVVYRRRITAAMITCLWKLWAVHNGGPVPSAKIDERHRFISDFAKLRYWGLIEESQQGWKITARGIQYLYGQVALPKYVYVYNGELKKVLDSEDNPLLYVWDSNPSVNKEVILREARNLSEFNMDLELFPFKGEHINLQSRI